MDIRTKSWIVASVATGLTAASSGVIAADDFSPYTATATGSQPEAVVIGDINNDGKNDVILTTSYANDPENDFKLFVFIQDDNGTLSPPVIYSTQASYVSRPTSVDIADLNSDGLMDVVVGETGSGIEIFYQDEAGELSTSTLITTPFSLRIRAGDLNGDGMSDLAGIGWSGSEAGVFLQNDNGTLDFSAGYFAPHGGYDDLELGDINNDGLTDIVVMSGQSYSFDNLAVLPQLSDGTFSDVMFYDLGGNETTRGLGIGDINGDQLADVVVSYGGNSPSSNIAIFAQSSQGVLNQPVNLASNDIPESLDIADVTADQHADVIVLHGGWLRLGVYEQLTDGSLAAEALYPIPYASHYNPHGLAVGDINSDGMADVVIADYNNGLVTLLNKNQPLPPANELPVSNAGDDRVTRSRRLSLLDGTDSYDPDGSLVAYDWYQLSGSSVRFYPTSTPGIVLFRAPRMTHDDRDELVFELTVTDDDGATDTDEVRIQVVR
ncbi:MAG: FG-GAP-like repeat-containing protein [Candidatus Thiodiazotropha sp.]